MGTIYPYGVFVNTLYKKFCKKEPLQKNLSSHYVLTTLFSAKAPKTMLYALLYTFRLTK